jgi:diguanylate cyclase (GGDEF)-like protein
MPAEQTAKPIRILFVEDLDYEAELALSQLRRAGIECTSVRVETEAGLREALEKFSPNLILSDFSLPQFDGVSALRIASQLAPEVPFIYVSGTIGEERAIDALLCGAADYVLKGNLARLPPAVRRALADAQARRERLREQAQLARLDRVLRMLSGINALVVRIRERKELLQETCRLAVSVGRYATAIVCAKAPSAPDIQPITWSGVNEGVTGELRTVLSEHGKSKSGIVTRVINTGTPYVCNDTSTLEASVPLKDVVHKAGLHSMVALPLLVDNTAMGVLVLTAHEAGAVSEEELRMLREVAGNLSFALQFLQKDTTVKFLSHFDSQTGLAKRSLFCERLSRLLNNNPDGRRSRYAVAVIDVERLSLINDSYGRRTGDLLLQHISDRLKRRFPQTEHIAHFGGGMFAVLRELGALSLEETAAIAQEHAVELFGEPFVIEQREIPVAVRSGFAVSPIHGKDANTLVQNAEVALRNARTSGERQLHYSPEEHSQMVSQLALEHKLRMALERRQFELYYQPKIDVRTRRIQGVEALIRWNDPDNVLVSPAAFLPVLESTGMILDVGQWVVEKAAEDLRQWLQDGLSPVRIAVNVSPGQLRLPGFVPNFQKVLKGWASEGAGLDIEITEGAIQEESAAEVRKLKLLRGAGVRIAIDDFGTGYSSLSRLSSLPIDTLKIDRSFILQVPGERAGKILVETIISLARAFNMTTVAEGVETQEQLDFLWHVGCNQSQGYLHSKPIPAAEFAELLANGKGRMVLPAEGGSVSPPDTAENGSGG